MNFFDIAPTATGSLVVKDQTFSRGCGYAEEQPASFVWRDADVTTQDNPVGFQVVMDGVTFRDWSWFADHRGYFPLARGVPLELRDCVISSYSMAGGGGPAGNEPVLQTQRSIRPGPTNLLASVVDTTCGSLSPSPANLAPSAGWVAIGGSNVTTVSGKGSTLPIASTASAKLDGGKIRNSSSGFYAVTNKLPKLSVGKSQTLLNGPAVAALRLTASTTATAPFGVASPRIRVQAGTSYVLGGWLRVAQVSGALNITALFYQWAAAVGSAPAPSVSAPLKPLMATSTATFGLTGEFQWEPLLLELPTPADAGSVELQITVEPGATVDFFALSLR